MSYSVSRITRKSIHSGDPFSLSIEPTTACNLGCPECPSGLKQFTRPTGKLDQEMHIRMLDQVKGSVFYINYYFQGEPFLHPDFLALIREAKKDASIRPLPQMHISSTKKKLKRLFNPVLTA